MGWPFPLSKLLSHLLDHRSHLKQTGRKRQAGVHVCVCQETPRMAPSLAFWRRNIELVFETQSQHVWLFLKSWKICKCSLKSYGTVYLESKNHCSRDIFYSSRSHSFEGSVLRSEIICNDVQNCSSTVQTQRSDSLACITSLVSFLVFWYVLVF